MKPAGITCPAACRQAPRSKPCGQPTASYAPSAPSLPTAPPALPPIAEPEEELQLRGLLRSFSVAPGKPMAQAGLPRNASLPLLTDKKCRGGNAAAALLSLRG